MSGHTEIGVVILQQVNFLFLITHKFIVNKVQGELLQQLTHETSTEIGRPFFFKAEGVLGGRWCSFLLYVNIKINFFT